MWNVWERGEVHTGYLYGNMRERDHVEDLGVNGSMKMNLVSA
jgi:hypothetical protein